MKKQLMIQRKNDNLLASKRKKNYNIRFSHLNIEIVKRLFMTQVCHK